MILTAATILRALKTLEVPAAGVTGVGVDLVDVTMLEGLMTSGWDAFLGVAWTELEQRDAEGAPERLAARWAVKEAVMKALGLGLGDVDPLDIEVVRGVSGAPAVRLRASAAEAARQVGVENVHVSMSHEQGWAAGFAVVAPKLCEHCAELSNVETKGGTR